VLQGNGTTPGAPALPRRGNHDDFYILRGFVWCAICDQAMTPVQLSTGVRHYRCCDPNCSRRLVLAEVAERLVWDHFAYLNPAQANDVEPAAPRCTGSSARCGWGTRSTTSITSGTTDDPTPTGGRARPR
jgi:Recombinase zinc beta ribbon domain